MSISHKRLSPVWLGQLVGYAVGMILSFIFLALVTAFGNEQKTGAILPFVASFGMHASNQLPGAHHGDKFVD